VSLKIAAVACGVQCFANDDLDGLAAAYDADPRVPPPFVFISCPCTRDPTWPVRFPGKSNAIVIVEARHEWFAAWEDARVRVAHVFERLRVRVSLCVHDP
jgi:hypothetical protein